MSGNDLARHADRLARLRSVWPEVTSAEVRDARPTAYRSAVIGALLLMLAVPTSWLSIWLFLDASFLSPGWLDSVRGLLMVVLPFGAICLWIAAVTLLLTPTGVRRAIALQGFAREVGLRFASDGPHVPPVGLYFAEGALAAPADSRARLEAQRDHFSKSMFRSRYSLYMPTSGPRPRLQIAFAAYLGGKNSPRVPRANFRFLRLQLSRRLPHLVTVARRNGSTRAMLPGSTQLSLEGDFDRHFTLYVPPGYERDALELFTPDVMACLIDHGKNWDIEIVEDQLIVVSSRVGARADRSEVTALLHFADLFGAEIGHQAATYSDPRAQRPRTQVAAGGRRLLRRSEGWIWAAVCGLAALCFAFPFVLMWFIEGSAP